MVFFSTSLYKDSDLSSDCSPLFLMEVSRDVTLGSVSSTAEDILLLDVFNYGTLPALLWLSVRLFSFLLDFYFFSLFSFLSFRSLTVLDLFDSTVGMLD